MLDFTSEYTSLFSQYTFLFSQYISISTPYSRYNNGFIAKLIGIFTDVEERRELGSRASKS
jgi:hypothetical protein